VTTPNSANIDAFWAAFCASRGITGPMPELTWFGDSEKMQTELCELVRRGVKQATASLAKYYGSDGDPLPKPGDLAIVIDGFGNPHAIIEVTSVDRAAFNTVTAQFAADEGEGDGALDYWLTEHRAFFTRWEAKEGANFSETDEIIFERFRLIWS
jgi:uncharacterized protein YhfF